MSAQPQSPQFELFEFTQSQLGDGRIVITPIRFAPRKPEDYIDMHQARALLNGMDEEEVAALIKIGEIDAWRKKGRRTKYHINRASVLAYRERMKVFKGED